MNIKKNNTKKYKPRYKAIICRPESSVTDERVIIEAINFDVAKNIPDELYGSGSVLDLCKSQEVARENA